MNEDGGDFLAAVLSEWLRSLTRNQMGSARTGSNPVDRVLLYFHQALNYYLKCIFVMKCFTFEHINHKINGLPGYNCSKLDQNRKPLSGNLL